MQGIDGRLRELAQLTINTVLLLDVDDDKTNTEIWYCNYCKIIVTKGDVKLIDKTKIQMLLIGFSFGCPLTGA